MRWALAIAVASLSLTAVPASANAIEEHELAMDESGIQLDWRRADDSQRGYVRVDHDGWVGAGTHDAAANGAGAHLGTDTTVGYGLGQWWCDAGLKADEPDLVYSRGTECWSYDCLDEGTYSDLLAYALADPVAYLQYASTYAHLC